MIGRFATGLLLVLVPLAVTAGEPGPSNECPLAELKPEVFINLVEGFDKLISAPMKGAYFCYTGDSVESFWTSADSKKPQYSEWKTASVPAGLKGKRVTFVIPWGPGGEGGKSKACCS